MKRIVIALLPLVLLASFSLSAQEVVTSDQAVSINTPQWRIGLQVGGAYRLASADNSNSVLKEHYKKLKKGYTYGADATRFFNDYFGIGASFYVANGTLTSCKLKEGTNRPEKVTLSEDERIGLGHIGLSIGARLCF